MSPFPKPEPSFLCVPYKGCWALRTSVGAGGYVVLRSRLLTMGGDVQRHRAAPALQEFHVKEELPYPESLVLHGNPAWWPEALGTAEHCQKHIPNLMCHPASHSRLRGASHRYSGVKPGAAAWTHHWSWDLSFLTGFFPTIQQPSGCKFFASSVALLSALRQPPG